MENQGIMLQNEGLKQSIINYKNNTNTSSTNELTMELMKSSFIIPFIKNNEKKRLFYKCFFLHLECYNELYYKTLYSYSFNFF